MTQCFTEEKWENLLEKDDLVKLLQELQNRKGVLEKALTAWKDRYSDVGNLEEELEIASFYSPIVRNSVMEHSNVHSTETDGFTETLAQRLTRRKSFDGSGKFCPEEDYDESEKFSRMSEQYLLSANNDEIPSDEMNVDDEYFEVTSTVAAQRKSNEEDKIALENILERLKETREKVTSKCGEVDDVIAAIGKAANESFSLRERVGMTHRSLTMIEMRQEKVMREALYENVTANCAIRKLHEEVIQLRIRESQQQSDIQRLMAENSRLKMKLMEARFHGSASKTKKKKSASTSILPEEKLEDAFSNPISPPPPTPGPVGLHEIDDLSKPVCVGAIHRGSLSLYKNKHEQGTISVTDEHLSSTSFGLRRRKGPCPLCSDLPSYSDSEDEETTRTVGTSTADIENIVSHRRTIVVMGMVLPIPLFLACLLRTIEESMLMIGRVCFAELPPFDPTFPDLHDDVMESLKEMYNKVKQKIS